MKFPEAVGKTIAGIEVHNHPDYHAVALKLTDGTTLHLTFVLRVEIEATLTKKKRRAVSVHLLTPLKRMKKCSNSKTDH